MFDMSNRENGGGSINDRRRAKAEEPARKILEKFNLSVEEGKETEDLVKLFREQIKFLTEGQEEEDFIGFVARTKISTRMNGK